ncbi:CCAAT/enhancer-binding protein beta [Octopus bimaculoides]|uniref:BZIP domain-containing protein n=1 Tax=Octopus bimaculoides TaxID=37653 RepID=A0A0L8IFQ2_OCTBM|nr:CCAAT/enhancer-binding protein beta [Octopus bimaculoides]|eukprot:XP_014769329.1 PREDICTED: CCAAT/enhancer-binding protein beta-like [Octopus bimaculoides]
MEQFAMNSDELSDNDQDGLIYSLGAREPSFNLDLLSNPGSFSQVSEFLNSINSGEESGNIQSSMDQKLDLNYGSIPNIADATMNTTTFYEESNLSTIKESDLYNSELCLETSPPDLTVTTNKLVTDKEYRNKRERNNVAVRKSRIKAKSKRVVTQNRVSQLKEENKQLEEKIKTLVQELKLCRSLFVQKGSPIPEQLQSMLNANIL